MKILYSRTQTGAIQQWQIEVEENKFRTIEGQVDGKLTTSEWTICEGKNIGRSNETTSNQQAQREAESRYKKKLEADYWEDINDVDKQRYFEPMLAKKWDDYKDKIQFPIYTQGKLDGQRCIATKKGLFSRNGKEIVAVPHIWKSLQPIFKVLPDLVLDGELYNHELKDDFNKIISITRKIKPTEEDLIESERLAQYHIYDCVHPTRIYFSDRSEFLNDMLVENYFDQKYIKIVPTYEVETIEELDGYEGDFIQQGYEGQMIRMDAPYENKRSQYLLKRKRFEEEEFKILDIEEGAGNRGGMMGRIKFQTKEGKDFAASARGSYEFYKELLENKQNYIGKLATVRFQNYTPDSIPRFPVVKCIRNYE